MKPHTESLPVFISAYGPKLVVEHDFSQGGRTKQSFTAECDINNIMARYQKTGILDFVNQHEPQYGDVTGIDFQTAMEIMTQGQTMFNDLPSELRSHFNNDPAEFLEFSSNPSNKLEMARMGLLNPTATALALNPTPSINSTPDALKTDLNASKPTGEQPVLHIPSLL
ncbi:MAG: internal scaffolding protein [Microvirus sp.]|nr:MAG: internal scaffolding protein [Microvirus sp.]